MAFKIPKSAKHYRKNWRRDIPPKEFRILISDAIKAAGGNRNKLAIALGLTRSAVYQWKPPYRHDPYLPLKAAVTFLDTPELMAKYKRTNK